MCCYLAGVNSRRIRAALQPLLGAAHLSKSAVSRVVSRLKALFASWQTRHLTTECFAIVFLDGFHLKVRLARRVVAVPVLAVLGVTATGEKRLVALRCPKRRPGGTTCCVIAPTAACRPRRWSSWMARRASQAGA